MEYHKKERRKYQIVKSVEYARSVNIYAIVVKQNKIMEKIDYTAWGVSELIERIHELEGMIDTQVPVKKSIRIPFSESDLQDLQGGESFDWTFDGVDVHLFQSDYSCADCGEEIENGEEHEHEDDYYCINCVPV